MIATAVGRITLTPRLLPIAEHLWLNSALGYCTTMIGDQLVTARPTSLLSSGERVLWQALHHLAQEQPCEWGLCYINCDHPDPDVPNRAALATAIDMWEGGLDAHMAEQHYIEAQRGQAGDQS